jgi:mercuric ion binding protein
MKAIFTLLFAFSFSGIVFSKNVPKTETIVIKTKIYCDHCKACESCGAKFDKVLVFEKGIKMVTLDETAMTVTVMYNSKKTSPEEIRAAISKLGFDADDVKADPTAYDNLDGCCKKH